MVFFKLQLVMFFEGIRSERKLIETASLNLAHRWYLGYALDEALPDHSSLTRIRQRLGLAVFQRFFEQVVDLCQEAGLVWGRELFFDATKVAGQRRARFAGARASIARPKLTSPTSSPTTAAATRTRSELRRPPLPVGLLRLSAAVRTKRSGTGGPAPTALESAGGAPARPAPAARSAATGARATSG